MAEKTDQTAAGVDEQLAQCGTRLKELRAARRWTLDELAERTGLSKPFLSRLEAGDRRPSIAAVLTLARAFQIPVGALFDDAAIDDSLPSYGDAVAKDPCVVVRGKDAPSRQGDGLTYVSLSNTSRFANLQPIRLRIAADRKGDERYQHEGEEWVYVVQGNVRLNIGTKVHELSRGDAAHFDSRVPHRLTAMGGLPAEVIVVACPLPERSLPHKSSGISLGESSGTSRDKSLDKSSVTSAGKSSGIERRSRLRSRRAIR